MKGKLIVIEGVDCSGKESQSKRLVNYLESIGKKAIRFTFPMYDTPTGKIVGGPFLGKEEICSSFFPEKAPSVDPKVSSLYYAADRFYNIDKINNYLNDGYYVILDRYVMSNMAHQGCKIENKEERLKLYEFIEQLEFNLLSLPKPDQILFLYIPFEEVSKLKNNRDALDDNEKDQEYLKKAEETYLELAKMYNYTFINCMDDKRLKSIDEVHEDIKKLFN